MWSVESSLGSEEEGRSAQVELIKMNLVGKKIEVFEGIQMHLSVVGGSGGRCTD